MSTYLVAFAVGDYDFLETSTSDGILCRVYTPKNKEKLGEFALDLAVKVLHFFTEYFGIAYPLPKMDLLASADYPCGKKSGAGIQTRGRLKLNFNCFYRGHGKLGSCRCS